MTLDLKTTTAQKLQAKASVQAAFVLIATLLGLSACSGMETASPAASSDSDFEVAPPPNFTRGLFERRAPEPLYPIRARNLGVEGWVMLGFSVDSDGEVINSTIRTLQEQPEGYFESSAVAAARRLTFQNLRSEPVDDVRYVFRYQLEGLEDSSPPIDATPNRVQFREMLPQSFITPSYPEVALELGLEGYVVVNFTVTDTGAVEDIVIQESEPPGVFNEEAIRAAQRLRFEPRILLGAAVRVENVSYRFDWNLPR